MFAQSELGASIESTPHSLALANMLLQVYKIPTGLSPANEMPSLWTLSSGKGADLASLQTSRRKMANG